MRLFKAVIENIPIRYFIPAGFLLAAAATLFVYLFVAVPLSENKAFELTEQNFTMSVSDMHSRLTTLLGQGNSTAIDLDIFTAASKANNVALLVVDESGVVRFADNASFKGKAVTELPFGIDPAALKRATLTGQLFTGRNQEQHWLTGYAGIAFLEKGTMRRNTLVMIQSTDTLQKTFEDILRWPITVLGAALLLIAGAVSLMMWAKIDRRLGALIATSRELASEQEDLRQRVNGQDEFGQIADQLDATHKILETKRASLRDALEQANAANVAKSEFLSNMSHEIRTPMNGVIGSLQLMMSSNDEAEKAELAAASHNSAVALLHIINDILDFSKLEAGKIEIVTAPFLPVRMMRDIELLMRPIAFEKNNRLVFDIDEESDLWIVADEIRIRQVVNNLISNALKFTNAGTVTARMEIAKDGEGHALHVRVEDTGTGIAPDQLDKLFKRFSQLENARKVGGTGLGLAISQQLVQLMGGTIGVESEFGEGSAFWFRLPITIANHKAETADNAPALTGHALNILVAEDVKLNQLLIEKMLTRLGHKLVIANDGHEALAALDRAEVGSIDLILMDNQMPGMDGIETVRHIRARGDAKARLPIIALTADAMVEQREAFLKAGMDGFVSKPIEIDQLRFEIARVMTGRD